MSATLSSSADSNRRFAASGEMATRVTEFDWAATSLGPLACWPQSLRTAVGIVLLSPVPIVMLWGEDGVMIYNDAYSGFAGGRHPRLFGSKVREGWPEVADFNDHVMKTVLAGGTLAYRDQELTLHRSGRPEQVWMNLDYSPILDEAGSPAGVIAIVVETTERVLSDRALVQGDQRKALLLDLLKRQREISDPCAMMQAAADAVGRFLGADRTGFFEMAERTTMAFGPGWCSGTLDRLEGRLPDRIIGTGYLARVRQGETLGIEDAASHPLTSDSRFAEIGVVALIGAPIMRNGIWQAGFYVNQATPRVWTEAEIALVRDVAEQTWDAVERARAELGLRELNETLERRVEERTAERDRVWANSRDLLLVIGADGVFRAVNPAWTTLLGHELHEVIGHSFLEFIWPEDAGLTQTGLDMAASLRDLSNFENRYQHKNGTPRWISWHTSVERELVYAYGRDITDAKTQAAALAAAEDALRQAQKMEAVGQLTGGLAHDFNNLLTGISGGLEIIQTRLAQGRLSDIDRFATAAMGAAKRASALTHRLLAFSRRQTLAPKPTDINRLVTDMEELIRRSVGPGVHMKVALAQGLWSTLVDPNQLENALLNLCINARDAMPDGGHLTIETANEWLGDSDARSREVPAGAYVSLRVSDTGTGMPPEVVARAFDPFFTTKPFGQGTGLGLSMIYGFVRQSGGQIRVETEPGRGTSMCIHVPRHDVDALVDSAPDPATPDDREADGEVVMVIDDEPIVRMLITEVLEEAGYTVIEAADGPSGLRILQSSGKIDLLVTDVGLPGGLNGRQVADAARVLRPDLKVLFITGYAEKAALGSNDLERGMRVVTKPFAMDDLARKISEMIEG